MTLTGICPDLVPFEVINIDIFITGNRGNAGIQYRDIVISICWRHNLGIVDMIERTIFRERVTVIQTVVRNLCNPIQQPDRIAEVKAERIIIILGIVNPERTIVF